MLHTFRFLFDNAMRAILNNAILFAIHILHIRICEEMARIPVEDWKGTTSLSSTV